LVKLVDEEVIKVWQVGLTSI